MATNACLNPQPVCPREAGEGYDKCTSVCEQPGHAEVDAIRQALDVTHFTSLAGATIYVEGHDHACDHCRGAAEMLRISIVIGAPPIRAPGFTHEEVVRAALYARRRTFERLGVGRSFDPTVDPSESELNSAADVLSWLQERRSPMSILIGSRPLRPAPRPDPSIDPTFAARVLGAPPFITDQDIATAAARFISPGGGRAVDFSYDPDEEGEE